MSARRTVIALGASVAFHIATLGSLLGVAAFHAWPTAPIEIELHSVPASAKELPLGPPPPKSADGKTRPHRRARASSDAVVTTGGNKPHPGVHDAGAPGADTGPPDGAAPDARIDAGGRHRDLRNFGPDGSRVTALLRLDRLRATPNAAATTAALDALLQLLPDRRRLIEGTDIDLYTDFDAILIATPNPLDDAVTFLAVRHHLTDGALKSGLDRGAARVGRSIAWRMEGGRPFGLRQRPPLAGGAGDAPGELDRDDRVFVLPEPGLAVIAAPAYASLLLPPAIDGGAPKTSSDWRRLIARIDAEDGAMPNDAVLMMTAANVFRGRNVDLPSGTSGLDAPEVLTLLVSLVPQPAAELTAEFTKVSGALGWEERWPSMRQRVLDNPLLELMGLSPILEPAQLDRDDRTVTLRTRITNEELLRLLQLAAGLFDQRSRRSR